MDERIHCGGDRRLIGNGEQLLDVPCVLAPAGVQLQQNQTGDVDYRHRQFSHIDRSRTTNNVLLPSRTSDHDVDIALLWLREANDSRQRIVGSAAADFDNNVRLR